MHTNQSRFGASAALALAAVMLTPVPAAAATYWISAKPITVDMPNPSGTTPVSVPMWGYALCDTGFANCATATVPGPELVVPAGDSSLVVNLRNDLPSGTPTSLVINGLFKPMVPVWSDGSSGARGADLTKRVRSFDVEVATPGSAVAYTWNNVRPGTYLYQSGTNPQVQVQMGLYGAASRNAAEAVPGTSRAQAYAGAAFEYDNRATLLYSEIDPVLHAAVNDGTYGTTGPKSTLDYAPKYFLVNGQPFPFGTPLLTPAGDPGVTLLRLLNAGLTTHVPMIVGTQWTVVAEDARPYPYSQRQQTALLPAAKTMDVLLTPPADIGGGTRYPIMDRRLSLSNAGLSDGGMMTVLSYGAQGVIGGGVGDSPANAPPVAGPIGFNSVQGVRVNVVAPGVLASATDADGPLPLRAVAMTGPTSAESSPVTNPPTYGTYALKSDGSFTYTPAPGYTGATDSFTYSVTDGKALSAPPGTVTIALSTPSAPTLTLVDDFLVDGTSLGADWDQQAATASSAPDIGASGGNAVVNATALGGLALRKGDLAASQGAGFPAGTTLAGAYLVLKATGGTAVSPANYVRVGCEGGQVVVATKMGGSNLAVFVRQAAFGACPTSGALSAAIDAKGLVTTFLNGVFAGGVQLPDVGVWKGTGRIGMQIQAPVGTMIPSFLGGAI